MSKCDYCGRLKAAHYEDGTDKNYHGPGDTWWVRQHEGGDCRRPLKKTPAIELPTRPQTRPPISNESLEAIRERTGGRLVNALELAAYLNVSRSQIYTTSQRRQWPHYRVGRTIRWDLDEVVEFVRTESQYAPYSTGSSAY